jgi:hypothetical protein
MGASHAPSSVVPSTRLPRLKTVGKGEGGRGKGGGEGELVGFLGLPTPFRGRSSNNSRRGISHSAQGCMRRPLERFCPAGDRLNESFLTHYDEKNACTEAKQRSILSDLQQLHERLHFRSGLNMWTIAEFQRAKINDRRGRPSDE